MKKRYKLLSITLSLLLLFGTIPSIPVSAASNPYGKYQTIGGITTVRCTWYAWQQAYDRTGVALPALGDGGQWYSNAKNKGLSVGTTAKENSIAVWSGDSYGHVAYVVGVSGNKMTVNEAGQYVGDKVYGNEGIVNGAVWSNVIGSSKTSGSNKKLVGFIYLSTNNSGEHTHIFNEYESYRAEHPHYNYYKCSCGATQTNTNEPNYVESCEICNPLKVTATDESKPTGFSWYNFENAKSYDLRINKMPSGENILTEFGIKNNEYSYNLPAGDYRAELCAGNVNGTIDWFPTVDFTVDISQIEFQPSGTAVIGNKIYATFDNEVSFDYAKEVSKALGGYLASISNKEEQEAIESLISTKKNAYWLGGRDNENEGVWKWEDGTTWTYENWDNGEPNNGTYYSPYGEDFLEIDAKTGLWNDKAQRYNSNLGFVAEFLINEIESSQSNGTIRTEYDSKKEEFVPVSKYTLFNKGVPWEVAEAYCEKKGGHLATVSSQPENNTIVSIIETGTYFLGATDKYNESNWQWVNEERFSYNNWITGEPNNYGNGEDYLSIKSNGWNDMSNSEHLGFVLEIDIANTYPETPQIEIEVVGNEIFVTWNKCDNADKYNAYLTYYITEEDLINNGFDPESFYASMIWEAEDQELNVGASIGDYMFSYFVAQTNATYRIKVEAVNSTTEAKTVAYSEAITIKKYKAGDMDGDNNVTDQDAIYLLFNCYFPDEYPLTQTADFNKDGAVNDQDAIYLLFYVYFPKEYPI